MFQTRMRKEHGYRGSNRAQEGLVACSDHIRISSITFSKIPSPHERQIKEGAQISRPQQSSGRSGSMWYASGHHVEHLLQNPPFDSGLGHIGFEELFLVFLRLDFEYSVRNLTYSEPD
jgi:hypothetical protein